MWSETENGVAPSNSNPTETSPLLGTPQQENGGSKFPPAGAVGIPNSGINGPPYDESAQHAGHLHASPEERAREVEATKPQLKYILPAISIGVS